MSWQRLMEVQFGNTRSGLTTVAYSLDQSNWITAGVYEDGIGVYKALVTFPNGFKGNVYWRTGDNPERFAQESITDPPASPYFPQLSYLTVAQAEEYFATRLNSDAWDCATDTNKNKALIAATQRMDALNYKGLRTADYNAATCRSRAVPANNPDQPLEFPRDGETDIPNPIYVACCEIAFSLLDGVDPELELQNINVTQHGFASLQETYNSNIVNLAFRHGIPSVTAWNLLLPYLADPFEISIVRSS